MPSRYIKISCHGSYEKSQGVFTVPDNTQLLFYCIHGTPSDSDFCRWAENKDMSKGRPNDFDQKVSHYTSHRPEQLAPLLPGQECYNYTLEPFGGGGDGFFNAPKSYRKDMVKLLANSTLSAVIKPYARSATPESPMAVHCLFCRCPPEVELPRKASIAVPRKKQFGFF
jgi:hypothetical protein